MAYSHNFGKGFMEFLPVRFGRAVSIGSATLVGPGVDMPDGTRVGPGSNLTTLTQMAGERCVSVQGNLPRRCLKDATGLYIHEGSNVRPWEEAVEPRTEGSPRRSSTRLRSRRARTMEAPLLDHDGECRPVRDHTGASTHTHAFQA